MLKTFILCGLTVAATAHGVNLAAQSQPVLLVVNQGDRTLSIIDATSAKTIAAVPVGGVTGHEIAVSPDGRTAFVPIYGSSGVGKPGTDGHAMAIVDVRAGKVTGTVDFGHGVRPHRPVYDAKRGVLYVTTELDKSVSVVDPTTLKVVGAIPTGQSESHMLVLSHDGRRGYTANVGPGTVSVLDMDGRKTIAVVPVAGDVQRIAISNDDRMVFTSDQAQPRLAVIDTGTNKVSRWVTLPSVGYGTAVTKDGRYLLVTERETGKMAVVDLQQMSVVRTVDVGKGPVEVLVRPDGRVAYVSCSPDGTVAELALDGGVANWHVSRMLRAGTGADGLAWVGQ